jgi:hypothetical protein
MKCVCIIDSDERSLNEIRLSIEQIDVSLKLFEFGDLEGFQKWVKDCLKQSQENPKAEKVEIKLLVGDLQFIGPKYFGLLENVRKLFIRTNLCSKEDPTAFVVTAFDSPSVNHKLFENPLISNVIFKPFDKMMLVQHLRMAIVGHHLVSESSVFKQKVKIQVEMLKEIEIVKYSELGFVTRSDRAIQVNSIAKYYGENLFEPGHAFTFARCIRCEPINIEPKAFEVQFEFFGLGNSKVKFVRQSLFKVHDRQSKVISKGNNDIAVDAKINLALIQEDQDTEIKGFLEKKFKNLSVQIIFEEGMLMTTFKNQKTLNGVIFNLKNFDKEVIQKWKQEIDQVAGIVNTNLLSFAVLRSECGVNEINTYSLALTDVIQFPIDRTYFFKRLSHWFEDLILSDNENLEIYSQSVSKILKVASPVDLVEISEAGLSMKYYREIDLDSFRRFSLGVGDGAADAPEILGECYFNQKVNDYFVSYFVFFGVTDHYLKKIRKWILDSHILTKQAS